MYTNFYIRDGYIYSQGESGHFYIQENYIYGPNGSLPWLR